MEAENPRKTTQLELSNHDATYRTHSVYSGFHCTLTVKFYYQWRSRAAHVLRSPGNQFPIGGNQGLAAMPVHHTSKRVKEESSVTVSLTPSPAGRISPNLALSLSALYYTVVGINSLWKRSFPLTPQQNHSYERQTPAEVI